MQQGESPIKPEVPQAMVDQNVEAIMALQSSEQLAMTRHQRAIERLVLVLTYPAFLFGLVILIGIWIGVNAGMKLSGRDPFDEPPFGWLQTVIGVLALIMTSIIVITQNRQGKVAERDAHPDLQVNLLVDQKAAKIIQLLEEMRADSPILRNRRDEMAEELQIAVDPTRVASVIAEKLSVQTATEGSASPNPTGGQTPPATEI